MQNEQQGIFYGLGRGIFIALMVVTLPAIGVTLYYDRVDALAKNVTELPIFDDWEDNFLAGADVLGQEFGQKLRAFYNADSTRNIKSNFENAAQLRHWRRDEINSDIQKRLKKGRRTNAAAYMAYIDQYKSEALQEMSRTKIPASITLAQGLLESDAGRGFLARKANNHFGIKCRLEKGYKQDGRITRSDYNHHSLAIDCIQRHDDYVWDHFEVYTKPADSFRRHSLLLQNDRYRWMIRQYEIGATYDIPRQLYGKTKVPYYGAWSVGLKTSGYATAPNYAEQLTAIIETYQLWKIDYELLDF